MGEQFVLDLGQTSLGLDLIVYLVQPKGLYDDAFTSLFSSS